MPGSACRRSSASPPTERRSTTSSTVKPRSFFPRPTSGTTVVPGPASPGGSGWRSARHPSTTVTSVPRTLTRPATTGGAPGIRVGVSRGRISRTRSASAAQTRVPTRNSSSRTPPASLIRSEEAKILQGVALSTQSRAVGRLSGGRHHLARPFRAQDEPRARHRMGQREQGRVQQLPRRERLEALRRLTRRGRHAAAAAERVLAVAHHRMSHMRQMDPDLVSAPGAELDARQVGVGEARHHAQVGEGVAPAREHRHALAILGMTRDRRLDVHRAVGEVPPGERRVHPPQLAPLDHARQAAMRQVGLGDEQQARRIAVEPVDDAGPPLRGRPLTLRQRRAPRQEHVDERVVPVTGAGMHDQARRLVEDGEVLVFIGEREIAVGGGVAPGRRLLGRQLHGHHGAALQLDRGAQRAPVTRDVFVGDEAGGDGAGQRELIGEETVETLGLGNDHAEGDGGHQGSAALASFARSCARPSSQSDTASAIAPTVMAESATLKVGQRVLPIPTSTKSTTPRALRTRSITLPTAPAHTSARATMRKRSPGRVASTMDRSTNSATIASAKKIQREYAPRHSPNAAHWLNTSRSCTMSPTRRMGRVGASHASASSLVARSATTTTAAVPQNTRRSATLAIFLLGLALDAEPRVRQRVEPLEHDVLAALLALAELLGRLIQPPQGLVDVPQIAALLRGEQERLLALHGVGALVRHVERVAREVAVRRLQARVERLAVIAELLHHAGALLEQPLFEMGQLLLVQTTLGRLGFGLRRHYRVPPFRPSWRRSAIATRRASMSRSPVTSASSSTAPSTTLRASVSPSTKL